MNTAEIVYKGHDNTIDLVLKADGAAVDLSSVTRMTLNFDGTVVDSDTSPDAFDWSQGGGKLGLRLGAENLAAGRYSVRLVVYDPANTDGIVWGDIPIVVRE